MNEREIQNLFGQIEEKKVDSEQSKKILQEIIEKIEDMGEFSQNEHINKIYALSLGKFFLQNGLTPWEMAEKSIYVSETYLLNHPMDYEVNSIYLLLTDLTFKFEQTYQRAIELYQSGNQMVIMLALQFLALPDLYQESIITKSESEKYYLEYQARLKNNNQ